MQKLSYSYFFSNFLLFCLGISLTFTSCAPVFSEMQSARTVGKGKIELTPALSQTFNRTEGENEVIQEQIGGHLAYGITPRLDIRLRYEYLQSSYEETINFQAMGLGLKYAIVPQRLAFYLAVGGIIQGSEEAQMQCHPTLLVTLPLVTNKLELNLSTKSILYFDVYDPNVIWNLGLGLSTNLNKWTFRPEYGRFYGIEDGSRLHQFSLGFSWIF